MAADVVVRVAVQIESDELTVVGTEVVEQVIKLGHKGVGRISQLLKVGFDIAQCKFRLTKLITTVVSYSGVTGNSIGPSGEATTSIVVIIALPQCAHYLLI